MASDKRAADCPGCRYGVCPRHDERAAVECPRCGCSIWVEELGAQGLHVVTDAEMAVLEAVRDWKDGKIGLERIVQAELARREEGR